MSFLIGFLGVIFGIILILIIIYILIIVKLRQFGFKGLKLSSLKDEIEDIQDSNEKQISGMTEIFLPQITKDIPNRKQRY